MARLTGATWQPLGKQTQPAMSAHDIWCVHTMVGSLAGTRSMFQANGYGGTESHTGVGHDGECDQWQDVAFTADANYRGNPTVLSTETADYGPGFPKWNTNDGGAVPAWTDAQVERLIDMGVQFCLPGTDPRSVHRDCPRSWDCYTKGIPPVLIPDTKPGRRGIAYHAQGVPGNGLVAGGVQWSTARGKVCPGARRIAQLKTIVIPAIAARIAGEGADVPLTPAEKNEIADLVVSKLLRAPIRNSHDGKTATFAAYVVYGNEAARFARANASAAVAAAKDGATQARAAATAAEAAAAETKALIDGVVTVDVKINGSVQP